MGISQDVKDRVNAKNNKGGFMKSKSIKKIIISMSVGLVPIVPICVVAATVGANHQSEWIAIEVSKPLLSNVGDSTTISMQKEGLPFESDDVQYSLSDYTSLEIVGDTIRVIAPITYTHFVNVTAYVGGVKSENTCKIALLPEDQPGTNYYTVTSSEPTLKGQGNSITLSTQVNGVPYPGEVVYSLDDNTNASVDGNTVVLNKAPDTITDLIITATITAEEDKTAVTQIALLPDDQPATHYYTVTASAPTLKGEGNFITLSTQLNGNIYSGAVVYSINDTSNAHVDGNTIVLDNAPNSAKDLEITAAITAEPGETATTQIALLPDDQPVNNYYTVTSSSSVLKGKGSFVTLSTQLNGVSYIGAVVYSINDTSNAHVDGDTIVLDNMPNAVTDLQITATITAEPGKTATTKIALLPDDQSSYYTVTSSEPTLKGRGNSITLSTQVNGDPYTGAVVYTLDDNTNASVNGNVVVLKKVPATITDLQITATIMEEPGKIATTQIALLPDDQPTSKYYTVTSSAPTLQGEGNFVTLSTQLNGVTYTGAVVYTLSSTTNASVTGNKVTLDEAPTSIINLQITATITDDLGKIATNKIALLPNDQPGANYYTVTSSDPTLKGVGDSVTLSTQLNGAAYTGAVVYSIDNTNNAHVDRNKVVLDKSPSSTTNIIITATITDDPGKTATTKIALLIDGNVNNLLEVQGDANAVFTRYEAGKTGVLASYLGGILLQNGTDVQYSTDAFDQSFFAGLSLDKNTGVISGTPQYTVAPYRTIVIWAQGVKYKQWLGAFEMHILINAPA